MSPLAGGASSSARMFQSSSTKPWDLSSAIQHVLEWLGADPPVGLEERLVLVRPQLQIGIDDLLDRVGHLLGGKAGPDDLADRRALGGGAAQRDLVELLALLIEAEDADVADVMVAAGIDAARDVDLEGTDVLLALQVGEAARDALRQPEWTGRSPARNSRDPGRR